MRHLAYLYNRGTSFKKESHYNPVLFFAKEGDTFKTIMEESKKYDFVLMGDLRYTVMVERITGKLGIRLLENLNVPIFIV